MANKPTANGHQELERAPQQPMMPMMGGFGAFQMTPALMAGMTKEYAQILVRQQVALANRRDPIQVEAALLRFCENPDFAKAAVYDKPVGGDKKQQGLSARFAEAAFPVMKNLNATHTQIYDDPERQTWRVSVEDLETNIVLAQEVFINKRVEKRYLKPGQSYFSKRINSTGEEVHLVEATDDEVDTRRKALCSKVQRNLMLQHIPPDTKAKCLAKCIQIQALKDKEDPDAAIKKIVDSFFDIGVSSDDLKQFLGHSVRGITDGELIELRAMYVSIQDGEATWMDFLADREEERATKGKSGVAAAKKRVQELREKEGRTKRAGAAKPAPTPAAGEQTAHAGGETVIQNQGGAQDQAGASNAAEPRRRGARRTRAVDTDLTGDTQQAEAGGSDPEPGDSSTSIA
jgi:hypothetical protein